jgi:hypothetical protein
MVTLVHHGLACRLPSVAGFFAMRRLEEQVLQTLLFTDLAEGS